MGVYLGADRYLIGVNDPDEYTEQMEIPVSHR